MTSGPRAHSPASPNAAARTCDAVSGEGGKRRVFAVQLPGGYGHLQNQVNRVGNTGCKTVREADGFQLSNVSGITKP